MDYFTNYKYCAIYYNRYNRILKCNEFIKVYVFGDRSGYFYLPTSNYIMEGLLSRKNIKFNDLLRRIMFYYIQN